MHVFHEIFIQILSMFRLYFRNSILYTESAVRKGVLMFRLWAKLWKENRLLQDIVICYDNNDTRTHKIFNAIEQVCREFDLSKPIWLESNIIEFKKHAKTRFSSDHFVDEINFDFLEIHIIEEDDI